MKFKVLGIGKKEDGFHIKLKREKNMEAKLDSFFSGLGFDVLNLTDDCPCCSGANEDFEYLRKIKKGKTCVDIFFGTSSVILNIRPNNSLSPICEKTLSVRAEMNHSEYLNLHINKYVCLRQ